MPRHGNDPIKRASTRASGFMSANLQWFGFGLGIALLACHVCHAFNNDDQTGILWENTVTGEIAVWDMHRTNYVTSSRIKNDQGPGWTLVATADFNRDGETDLLWRSPATGKNEIWLMNGTNRIARHAIESGATNFYVVGAGDFNGDGYSDILWRDPERNLTAVWFMRSTNWTGQVGWISKNADANWRAVATGDCNNDGDTDIYWRNFATGSNAVWLMRGTNVLNIVGIRPEPDLGFHLATTGPFNPIGNTDLLWRHTNGVNLIWMMSGTNFLSSAILPKETNQTWTAKGAGGYVGGMRLSAIADLSSSSVKLAWRYGPTNLPAIRRREFGESAWTTLATNYLPFRFTNSNLTLGKRYEFQVDDEYIFVGLRATPSEHRGQVILVTEDSAAKNLAKELSLFRSDLNGDGWSVTQTNIPRHNDREWRANTNVIASLKSFITNSYFANPKELKAVILIGHVPIPYSGFHNPDGHGFRALPADGYYGDVDGVFTDTNVDFPSLLPVLLETRHDNRIGDGKFDQNRFPTNSNGIAGLELAVGRIDFSDIPIFTHESETTLLRRYLNKNHRYRHKQLSLPERIIVGTFFPRDMYAGIYAEALMNGSRWYGQEPETILQGDPFSPTNSAVWGIIGGYGLPYGVCGPYWIYHESKHVAIPAQEPQLFFANVFASYCLDMGYTNNFMRAFLGAPNSGLAATWFRQAPVGNIPLSFEQLGLGETIGRGFLRMINDNPERTADNTYVVLMGDPTLRLQVLSPPSKLLVSGKTNETLSWSASAEAGAQYSIYRSTSDLNGPWVKVTNGPITSTNFTDPSPPTGPRWYQVRAMKLAITGSGSFTNLSQGAFVKVP